MIIGPLNLAKAPTLTQCGSGKKTFCSNNNSPIASNHFSADPVLNPIVRLQVKLSSKHGAEAR